MVVLSLLEVKLKLSKSLHVVAERDSAMEFFRSPPFRTRAQRRRQRTPAQMGAQRRKMEVQTKEQQQQQWQFRVAWKKGAGKIWGEELPGTELEM